MNKKNITVITGFYYPEDTAIGLYTTQFCEFLMKKGYSIKVITGFPNYPKWEIFADYKNLKKFYSEKNKGIEIIRYKQFIPKKATIISRVLMMFSLFFGTFINVFKIKKTDLVICIVPFTSSILPSLLLSTKNNAKLWVHVQDFEFDLALDSGILKKDNLFFKMLKKTIFFFEKKLLNSADIVSSISYSMIKKAQEKSTHKNPYFFPNWISSSKINPTEYKHHDFINKDKFTLLYSGNIGEKQDWLFLEKFCSIVNDKDNIEIIVVGNGAFLNNLKKLLAGYLFVYFYEPIPYNELNNLLCSTDIHFLFQKTDIIDTVMPSKILGMMASEKPSIITGNEKSEVLSLINKSKGGFYFCSNDVEEVYKKIIELKNSIDIRNEIGKNARKFVLETFSEETILANFSNQIKDILDEN